MKIRKDFVSNSSSSSYIVFAHNGPTNDFDKYIAEHPIDEWYSSYEFPGTAMDHEFGWENCMYTGIISKLNFIGIQMLTIMGWKLSNALNTDGSKISNEHLDRLDEYVDRIKRVLKELNINARLSADLLRYHINGNYFSIKDTYIDHQSSVVEDANMEMLDSDEALIDFLKYDNSYIQGGNDNE